jgi:light-regulated signal transduction histidine kinase (bacteriophytochrome)
MAEPDELDRMVEAIQSMRLSLEKAFEELQAANRDMETEIEQKRRTEEKLQELVGQLTTSNTELQRFAYVASHDLQEPLRGIVLYTQKLERAYRGRLDSAADEYIDYIVGNAKQMYKLINDLLAFSRLGRGVTFAPVSLDVACAAAITNLHPAILRSNAKIAVSPLPELFGNALQITELLENLIDNAIKFARPDQSPEVAVYAEQEKDGWVVSVADNGIGVESSSQDVFEIFRRHHSAQAYPGTGVGLAICKRIVDLHHGRIWYRANPDQGTIFSFALGQPQSS